MVDLFYISSTLADCKHRVIRKIIMIDQAVTVSYVINKIIFVMTVPPPPLLVLALFARVFLHQDFVVYEH